MRVGGKDKLMTTRKPFRLKPTKPSEAVIKAGVATCLEWLKTSRKIIWYARINSAAGRLIFPDGSTSQFMRFGFVGCPDFIGQLPGGRFFGIETKSADGGISADQAAFMDVANKGGGLVIVARSVDDVLGHIA